MLKTIGTIHFVPIVFVFVIQSKSERKPSPMSNEKQISLDDYSDAFIAEIEAEFRRIYGIVDLDSHDCNILWELETEEERKAYLKKKFPKYCK